MQNIVVKSFFMSKWFWSFMKSLRNFDMNRRLCQIILNVSLHHECCNECKDGVKFRKRTVDEGLCEYIVSL